VQTAQGTYMVYVHAGTNPFDTITQAVKCVITSSLLLTLSVVPCTARLNSPAFRLVTVISTGKTEYCRNNSIFSKKCKF